MFRHPNWAIFAVACSLTSLVAWRAVAFAQDETREIQIKGEVKGLTNEAIVVEDAGGNLWAVKPPEDSRETQIGGPAEVAALMPGMLVKFNGVVTKKGLVKDPIKSLTIFTQRDEFDVGVFPEGGFGGDTDGPGLFGGDEKKKKKKKPAKPKIEEEVACRVGGQIAGPVKDGKLAIAAGGMVLKAEIAEDVKIVVDVADPNWVRPGDKLEANAYFYPALQEPNQPTQAIATRLTVKATEPYGAGAGKKGNAKKTAAKGKAKGKPKADADEEMDAEKDDDKSEEGDKAKDEKKPGKKPAAEKKTGKKNDPKKKSDEEMDEADDKS